VRLGCLKCASSTVYAEITSTISVDYTLTSCPPECSDGIDNDGDGKTDLDDCGCENGQDNNESDHPPKLIGLEVTQVIQDWQNSVPLVAGKKTWVRAHFKAMSSI
jgi:hypothetical protein